MSTQRKPIFDSLAACMHAISQPATPDSWQRGLSTSRYRRLRFSLVLFSICLPGSHALPALAANTAPSTAEPGQTVELRDGQHDFDFRFGVWHTHLRRVADPFSNPSQSFVLDGTVTVRKIWGGKAQLEEIEADGSIGHWEALTLFLYDPRAHQWASPFINSRSGQLDSPLIGSFQNGRAELYGEDTFNGKTILVRRAWSDIKPNSHHFEESYSNDGGRTWKATLIGDLTRREDLKDQDGSAIADPEHADPITPEEHQFDFDLGTWATHTRRLLHPLTGSDTWVELDGKTVVRKVWGGRANLAEYDADGSGTHVTLLALRWFNPTTHEWNLDFATPQGGTLGIPGVGTFKDGRAEFYGFDTVEGRNILIRFSIWKITGDTAQSEQAFSADGGKTWEVNWITHYTRIAEKGGIDAGEMTETERAYLLSELKSSKAALLTSIKGLTSDQWNFKPSPDAWSIEECTEHLILAEDLIFGEAQRTLEAPAVTRLPNATSEGDRQLVTQLEDRSKKAKAPKAIQPAGAFSTPESAAQEFARRRDKTIAYVETTKDPLRIHVGSGPAGDPADVYQFLLEMSAHSVRHTEQIREVKSSAGYPAS